MRQHLLSERGGENIKYYFTGYLGTSCADKKKGFHCLLCFCVDFASSETTAEWKARKGVTGFMCLLHFGGIRAAVDAFELLIERNLWCKPSQNIQPRHTGVFLPSLGVCNEQAWLNQQHLI